MTTTGDRDAFLAGMRRRLAAGVPANPAHPLPPAVAGVPPVRFRRLDGDDLLGSFVEAATAVGAVVHRIEAATMPLALITAIVARHDVRRAVVSAEPEAVLVGALLAGLGVEVAPVPATPAAAAEAQLGVTSAAALLAATGSVVLDNTEMRTRSASLLPPVHLCVASADRLVGGPSDVLRTLGDEAARLPSNLVFVTGPSRTGDIEQLLTIGVHGPTIVEIVVTDCRT